MSPGGFERRRLAKPEKPLKAVIECGDVLAGGLVESLTLDGLYVRLKRHSFSMSKERVSVDLFLAASNGPSILTIDARIVHVDETGVALQFRPMALSDHTRLKAVIAFISPDQEPEASP
jgi:hypothetical protein